MGAEVSFVAFKLASAVGCLSCGIGIAVDMVGGRWGEEPYDWEGKRFGHACRLTREGLSADQKRVVADIGKSLEVWSHGQSGGDGYQATLHDGRLPPERDEPETQA